MAEAKAGESVAALDQLCINTIRTLSMDPVVSAAGQTLGGTA